MNGLHCEMVVETPNAKGNVDNRERKFTKLNVVVHYVPAPDAESRIGRAIHILLAAAEQHCPSVKGSTNHEEDADRQTNTDDVGTDEGRAAEERSQERSA